MEIKQSYIMTIASDAMDGDQDIQQAIEAAYMGLVKSGSI